MSDLAVNNRAADLEVRGYEEHPELIQQNAEWTDLSPVEGKLCGISLGLGLSLLGVFLYVFRG